MAPKNKFTKEEMVAAALQVVRTKGIEGLTALETVTLMYHNGDDAFCVDIEALSGLTNLKELTLCIYDRYTNAGLQEKIPFFGVGMQYIRFAREEPELYRLLFLTRAQGQGWSAMQSMKHLQTLVRPTLMEIYQITELEADLYFRDLWFVVHSLSTLIVTGDCPYSAAGTFDRDAAFRALVGKGPRVQEDD